MAAYAPPHAGEVKQTPNSAPRPAPELPHRFAAREQAFGRVVGRQFDQRAIHFDAALAGGTGRFKRRHDLLRVTNLAVVR